jgi:hypothetical protein
LDRYPGIQGYRLIFLSLIALAAIGFVSAHLLLKHIRGEAPSSNTIPLETE